MPQRGQVKDASFLTWSPSESSASCTTSACRLDRSDHRCRACPSRCADEWDQPSPAWSPCRPSPRSSQELHLTERTPLDRVWWCAVSTTVLHLHLRVEVADGVVALQTEVLDLSTARPDHDHLRWLRTAEVVPSEGLSGQPGLVAGAL